MEVEKIKNELMKLGYSEYYTRVLLTLVSSERYLDAKEIEKASNVPIARIYSILINLEKENLIKSIPGNVKKYVANSKERIIEAISEKKEGEIKEEEKEVKNSLDFLSRGFSQIQSQITNVEINVFQNNEDYWKEYNEAVSRLKKDDVYRIINSMRLADSFLEEELAENKELKNMIKADEKKLENGVVIHHAMNPDSLVENTFKDVGYDKEKLERSMKKLLESYRIFSSYNHFISFTKWFKNIVIVIIKENVFIEFYNESSNSINTAIKIKSNQLASDLINWFEDFDGDKEHDPVADFKRFKEEIKKSCNKICKVRI